MCNPHAGNKFLDGGEACFGPGWPGLLPASDTLLKLEAEIGREGVGEICGWLKGGIHSEDILTLRFSI